MTSQACVTQNVYPLLSTTKCFSRVTGTDSARKAFKTPALVSPTTSAAMSASAPLSADQDMLTVDNELHDHGSNAESIASDANRRGKL